MLRDRVGLNNQGADDTAYPIGAFGHSFATKGGHQRRFK
jgi:hypothetical protein